MNKKLIFFDIDGTLIRSEAGISEPTAKTKEIIQLMIAKGHIPIVATGRPMSMILENIRSCGFNSFIASAGAYIELNGEVVVDIKVPTQAISNAFVHARKNDIALYTEGPGFFYTLPEFEQLICDFIFSVGIDKKHIIATEDFSNVVANKMFAKFKSMDNFSKFAKAIENDFQYAIMNDGNGKEYNGRVDILNKGVTKATAIEKIMETLNIAREDTYAVGDGFNDLEMFDVVGNGIALGNGVDELKAKASIITNNVEDEGIYNAFINMPWLK